MNRVGSFFHTPIFFDFGSASVKYCVADGVTKQLANYLLIERQSKRVVAIGESARALAHTAQDNLVLVEPIFEGTVANSEHLKLFVEEILAKQKESSDFFSQYALYYSCSPETTILEKKAFERALKRVRGVSLVRAKDYSRHIHSQLYGTDHTAHTSVILGAELSSILLTQASQVLFFRRYFWGGRRMEKKIQVFLKEAVGLLVHEKQLAQLLSELKVTGLAKKKSALATLRGKDVSSLQPKTSRIELTALAAALEPELDHLLKYIQRNICSFQGEALEMLDENGIVLTGALSQLGGMDDFLAEALALPVSVSKNPLFDQILSLRNTS